MLRGNTTFTTKPKCTENPHTCRPVHSWHFPPSPYSVKAGTVKNLGRGEETISDEENKKKRVTIPEGHLQEKWIPKKVIPQNLKTPPRTNLPQMKKVMSNAKKPKLLHLPYLKGLSDKIQRECMKIGVRAVFKSSGTLRQMLTKVKNCIPEMSKKDVVYQIPC